MSNCFAKMYRKINLLFTVILLQIFFETPNGQRSLQFFRKDYIYKEATQSFYKIHTMYRTWAEAKRQCASEGAILFYPEDQMEVDVVLGLVNETTSSTYLYIGISDIIAETVFQTVDGRPILDVYNNWAMNEPDNAKNDQDCIIIRRDGTYRDETCSKSFPFICKKALDTIEWNQKCNMPYLDYTYNEALARCYKFHGTPSNWTDAMALCNNEGSYLAVINTQKEAEYLVQLTASKAPKKRGGYTTDAIHLGFHNQMDEGWTTVTATSLEESGYEEWAEKQPDNPEQAKCGSMFFNGRLNDIGCEERALFICEHEVSTPTSMLDIRFSE